MHRPNGEELAREKGLAWNVQLPAQELWGAGERTRLRQIALAVGFSDGAHFTRTFQREMETTPRAYRDSKQR